VEIFFEKIFVLAIPTAQKTFCQVAELLMPREWCRKRDFTDLCTVLNDFSAENFRNGFFSPTKF